jgi:hypothetical protein
VIQPPERVGADASHECDPARWERPGGEIHRLAPDSDEQQRRSALRLGLGEPLRTPAEVGEVLGIAPESVRRLERSALQKLGHLVAWLDYVLAYEPNVGVPPAAIRYFPPPEPLASAGAPRRELLQRDRRAAAS